MGLLPSGAGVDRDQDQEAALHIGSGRWLVPSPLAGTISEALELAGPGDEIIVDPSYDSRWAEASGASAAIPKGAPESFPLRIETSEIKISCTALPRRDGNWDRPQIFAPPDRAAVVIVADGVTVEGCEVRSGGAGIVAAEASDIRIIGNLIRDVGEGIRLVGTSRSLIKDNRLSYIQGAGIHLERAEGNLLQGNSVAQGGEGLFLTDSQDNLIADEVYRDNGSAGLHLQASQGNFLVSLTVTGNGGEGVLFVDADQNEMADSTVSANRGGGVVLVGSDDNEIHGNIIEENEGGAILLSGGELVSFVTPLLDPEGGRAEVEDPFAEARRERAALQGKIEELEGWIGDLGRELLGMIGDVSLSRQTFSAKIINDVLDEVIFIKEAALPLAVDPLVEDARDGVDALRWKDLGPQEGEILEDLDLLLQRLTEAEGQLARLGLILDDGEREDDLREFDDVVDWLEQALSASGGGERQEALEGARKKLEAALVQSGRAALETEGMLERLRAIAERLPPSPPPDFAIQGRGVIAETVAPAIADEEVAQLEGGLVDRLAGSETVLLKAERLGLLPIDAGDLELKRQELPTPRGNVIGGNLLEGGPSLPWGGRHLHLFTGLIKTGCLQGRPQGQGQDLLEEGACKLPTEAVVGAEVRGGVGDASQAGADIRGAGIPRVEAIGLVVNGVWAHPNPVRGMGTVHFSVAGLGIAQILVEVFDLAGDEVVHSGWRPGRTFAWHLRNRQGGVVANGVYLYVVTVRSPDGKLVRSEVEKLVVLR